SCMSLSLGNASMTSRSILSVPQIMMRTLVNVSGSITSGVVGNRILSESSEPERLIDYDTQVSHS
ncbi:hypothetical protein ACS8FD_13995, partial [Psychrobacter sp. 1U2]|uniref:hypothetical protein n=1 Tax=Psychrobacter sp. 1U2 TaxID=3453577 RepID=UPI003F44DEA7